MQVSKTESQTIFKMIDKWREEEIISSEQSNLMKSSFHIRETRWVQLAYYAFSVAVVSMILAVIVLLADKPIRLFLERVFNMTHSGIALVTAIMSLLLFIYSHKRISAQREFNFSNFSLIVFSSFLTLVALSFTGKALSIGENYFYGLFYAGFIIYLILSQVYSYSFLWVFALLFLVGGIGSHLHTFNTWNGYLLGMNEVLRFLPVSVIFLLFTALLKVVPATKHIARVHYYSSWIFVLFVLWILSITGNYTDFERWVEVSQFNMFFYAFIATFTSFLVMFFAWKKGDNFLGNISLIFLILNLFTRYFEYLWKPLHKSVFFFILGFIFIIIGRKAEQYWNLKK